MNRNPRCFNAWMIILKISRDSKPKQNVPSMAKSEKKKTAISNHQPSQNHKAVGSPSSPSTLGTCHSSHICWRSRRSLGWREYLFNLLKAFGSFPIHAVSFHTKITYKVNLLLEVWNGHPTRSQAFKNWARLCYQDKLEYFTYNIPDTSGHFDCRFPISTIALFTHSILSVAKKNPGEEIVPISSYFTKTTMSLKKGDSWKGERVCSCTRDTERLGHPDKNQNIKTWRPRERNSTSPSTVRTTKIPVQVATAWRLRPALAVPSRLPELLRRFLQPETHIV